MGKKRKSDLEIVVGYFTTAPLTVAADALLMAKAIVAARSPQTTAHKPRPKTGARSIRDLQDALLSEVEAESRGNA